MRKTITSQRFAAVVFILAVAATAACGKSSSNKQATTTTTASTATDASSPDASSPDASSSAGATGVAVTATPATGPRGSSFTITATGFAPGSKLSLRITRPTKTVFAGPQHVVAADGTVKTEFKVGATDPVGTYRVEAVDTDGKKASASFDVTAAGSTATTQ